MDNAEEQQNELEALEAIYQQEFQLESSSPPKFDLILLPNADGEGNHVALRMMVEFPPDYPTVSPIVRLRSEKGLVERQMNELTTILEDRLDSLLGEVAIFTLAEGLKEYLVDHNQPELSMHEQMMAKIEKKDTEEEERIAKRRALEERIAEQQKQPSPLGIEPGTLLTPESFKRWREMFDAEQAAIRAAKEALKPQTSKLTGKQLFQQNLAKELEDSEADKLVEEVIESKPVSFYDASLYEDEDVDEEDGEAKGDDHSSEEDDDDADNEEIKGMFDTDVSKTSSSAASSSASAPKPTSASSSSSSSSASTAASAASSSSSKPVSVKSPPAASGSSSSSSSKPVQPAQSKAAPPKQPPPQLAKNAPQGKKDAPKKQQSAGGKKK